MSEHTMQDGKLHRQVRKGGRERERDSSVFQHTVEDGGLHRQVRKGGSEREIVGCPIIPWRMGNYTDR